MAALPQRSNYMRKWTCNITDDVACDKVSATQTTDSRPMYKRYMAWNGRAMANLLVLPMSHLVRTLADCKASGHSSKSLEHVSILEEWTGS
ncbi:hypothetical protein H257_11664 [Aphanomyces astaci]|uniref:Uncharacterized protein n=1 Tax=Aphanomyces astaci TaxID=112090 RepID=W4G1F1_APHAT|nr:hypothetical protein H257_11664 [Aphanomyces astaci]ETV73537.1 hypothetical protein H257_11664 [Aphanomyces astaci]|eukprot:XP_009836963.1 hypothetical protein H257_11664 [Aphanomyces astaci]